MSPPDSPIASQSRRCSDLFVRLCDLIDHGNGDTLRSIPSAACQDEFGRFRIWANNIGALLTADNRNSLDVRLSRAAKVSSRILEFLGDLEEALNDVSSIAAGIKPNRVSIGSSHALGSVVSESHEAFDIVKDSITSLMKTSIVIRQATPHDRYIKANVSTENPFIDSSDIAHVGHKFPKLDAEERSWLKERLGKAMTQRRKYLKYCRDHRNKFGSADREVEPASEMTVQPHIVKSASTSYRQAGTAKSSPASTFVPAEASTLQTSKLRPMGSVPEDASEDLSDTHSQTSYATSVVDSEAESKLQPPSLRDVTNTFPFECPYCRSLQEVKNERSWR